MASDLTVASLAPASRSPTDRSPENRQCDSVCRSHGMPVADVSGGCCLKTIPIGVRFTESFGSDATRRSGKPFTTNCGRKYASKAGRNRLPRLPSSIASRFASPREERNVAMTLGKRSPVENDTSPLIRWPDLDGRCPCGELPRPSRSEERAGKTE